MEETLQLEAMDSQLSVTLEKKGTLFWDDHFSGAATKKKGEKGGH